MSDKPLELRFVRSATTWTTLPETRGEVAFVGRSNVGKSSLINKLANRKELAQVSKTPGRTRLINLFAVGRAAPGTPSDTLIEHALVDLPGYGYAAVSRKEQAGWPKMIENYLLERDSLISLFILVDAEIGPTKLDVQMLDWVRHHALPHVVVATKADKVKAMKRSQRRSALSRACSLDVDDIPWVSVTSGAGIDDLRRMVITLLDGY